MKLDSKTIRVIAFDCVNTVFDVSGIDKKAYIDQVRRPEWEPLTVDASWLQCPAHADSAPGISRLTGGFITATCSNWPAYVLADLSHRAGINWSAIVPMESVMRYKPHPQAYLNVCGVMNVEPSQVLMATANETAPDIETARELGMQAILIDREHKYTDLPKTIIELAEMLGC